MRTPWLVSAFALLASATACSEESYIVVTVDSRPAVHDATRLRVTLTNAGTTRTDELPLDGASFPVTFSVSAPGRAGDLVVQVDAVDGADLLVGRGTTATAIDTTFTSVMLETADFVVNTDYAEDQFPSDDYEAHGFQVSAGPDGTWTVAYRDRCADPCHMFARRFDAAGRPVTTRLAAGTNGFPVSTSLTTSTSTPAIATAGMTTLAVWDFREPSPGTVAGIACRAIDAMGGGNPSEVQISTDASSDVVSITPLSNSNFAVVWNPFLTADVIRSAVVRPDCTTLAAPVTVSTSDVGLGPFRASVAASGTPSTILYAWVMDGGVQVRLASNLNVFTAATDAQFLPKTALETVEFVRVAPLGAGFAVVVRWVQATGFEGPGRIELYRTNATGGVLGAPIEVSTRSGSDFGSSEGFSLATSPSGTLLVVWHSCLENGDGNGCGVFGRAFRSDGTPVGDEFVVATTTNGDQTNPSVTALLDDSFAVVWKDESAGQPDVSGSAVRARIVYPALATAAATP